MQRRSVAVAIGAVAFFDGMPFSVGAAKSTLQAKVLLAIILVAALRFNERSRRSNLRVNSRDYGNQSNWKAISSR